jgi:hypothetical protein
MELLWSYIEKVLQSIMVVHTIERRYISTGIVDEEVTVISIFP